MEFWPVVLLAGIIAILFAAWLARNVLSQDKGTKAMQEVASLIFEGAMAFLNRQYRTISVLALVAAVIIGLLIGGLANDPAHGLRTAIAFLVGAFCSGLAGFIGMYIAVQANLRTAAAAQRSVRDAINVSLRGGAVSGFLVVALSLLGVLGMYALFGGFNAAPSGASAAQRLTDGVASVPFEIVGFGFGASFVALFAQLGGGVYTKAAEVGAALVGKVGAGIPEDDPRNAAVIADLVGDNVGDCAGRGADLFESTAAENIGAVILGSGLAVSAAKAGIHFTEGMLGVMLFPLVARAFGLVASIIGIMAVRTDEDEDPMQALNRGYYIAAGLAVGGFAVATRWLLHAPEQPDAWLRFFFCGLVGIATSQAFVYITQYYTECRYRPVREIAASAQTGASPTIITGMAVALECTALPTIVISFAILTSYFLGRSTGIANAGLFGTAVATMGMLATAAYILAMDTFGPITDNAGGIVEMSHQPEAIRKKTDRLDAVGNTTKALTKGYAIGSAALAAFLLFSAYLDEVALLGSPLQAVDISKPEVFVGGLLGAMLVFWFSALAIGAVTKAAVSVIKEVRRQFQADPGILKGTSRPDYGTAVDIVTVGALKAMVAPGLLAVGMPIAVGLIFKVLFHVGAETVASFLMVGTIAGILMATLLNNGGGAWDNAKKFIETGEYGGKGSPTHKAAVGGDTVGDPFKDTAGPWLHARIKLLSRVTLVLAPVPVS